MTRGASLLLLLPLLAANGCRSWWQSRLEDGADVFTACVESPVYGARVGLGPLRGLGAYFTLPANPTRISQSARGAGLIGGQWTRYDVVDVCIPLLISIQEFGGFADDRRRKESDTVQPFVIPPSHSLMSLPDEEPDTSGGPADVRRIAPRYTQFEVVVGVGAGLRLGANPGEALDLLLGFFGLDLYGDDEPPITADSPTH